MLLDSNIIIYATLPEHDDLRQLIAEHEPAVSDISYVEVLGYHQLLDVEKDLLEEFFAAALMLPVTTPVLEQAIQLRQQRKLPLGDALIAATALVHQRTLVTRNIDDFKWISSLMLYNPFEESNCVSTD